MEKFLSNLMKITKIFFLISFSVSFVFAEIIDLENKGHSSTKMFIIAINNINNNINLASGEQRFLFGSVCYKFLVIIMTFFLN